MKILKRNVLVSKADIIIEAIFIDKGVTLLFVTSRHNNIDSASIYLSKGFNEVGEYKYDPDGIHIKTAETNKPIKKTHFDLLEYFWQKMQDKDRYNRTIDALVD